MNIFDGNCIFPGQVAVGPGGWGVSYFLLPFSTRAPCALAEHLLLTLDYSPVSAMNCSQWKGKGRDVDDAHISWLQETCWLMKKFWKRQK